MKLLMIYADEFAYFTGQKNLKSVPEQDAHARFSEAVVAFIHVEQEDEENEKSVIDKLVKNIKLLCGKLETKTVVLHSFAHLSESKAEPEFVRTVLDKAEKRLAKAGYNCAQTPFGYFLDLDMQAPGFSLARVFKSF
ncbi:MAG: hypothetical protein Kow0037_21290 [Calditrichia bacterium]